jgi:glycosyltransferase involved in cell wall biosynthesis
VSDTALSIVHTESSTGWGGQENRTLNECLGMRARGHRVSVVAQPGARLLERAEQAGLATFAVPMRKSFDLVAVLRLARIFVNTRADVVNTHSSKDTILAGMAARLLWCYPGGRPQVVRTRHLIMPITSTITYAWLPDHVVAVSHAVRQYLLSRGITEKRITVVPTGVDFSRFDQDAVQPAPLREELGLAADTVLIGTVAILRRKKGHHFLLEAAARLRDDPLAQDIRFVFVGDGPQTENLRAQIIVLGLQERVFMLGLRRDVPAVLAALDVFVLPTLEEALGTSFIEAQAMQLPVIGSRIGGVPETMREGDTGLLVPPGDCSALAQAILQLAGEPQRRRNMGQAGSIFVRDTYCLEQMVAGMEALYRRLCHV